MKDVKISHEVQLMKVTSQGGLDPNPVFPQYNPLGIYPYQYWSDTHREVLTREFRFIYLENKYLKIGFNLELGGRMWMAFDKLANRHAINFASGVYSYNGGFAKSYTCGGMEVNYPLAHSPSTRLPREHSFRKNPDGSASVIISEYEQRWRTRWSVKYTLYPDRSYIEMTPRLYNCTAFETRYMYWANCGIPLNDTTEFIFPEKAGAMHGDENQTFSWPLWKQANQGFWKNTIEPLGLYMLDATEDYFGYYDHAAKFGLAHWADLADLPGKKYWSWGSNEHARVSMSQTHHPDNVVYGEIQSGRIVIQEHLDRVPPQTEQTWNEYWYPVRSIGRFHGAGQGAVIAINTSMKTNMFIGADHLDISIQGTGIYEKAKLLIVGKDLCDITRTISICPEKITTVKVKLTRKIQQQDVVDVLIISHDGKVLCRARRQQINQRDTWLEIPSVKTEHKITVETLFQKASALDRDWNNHDSREAYAKVLLEDPEHSLTLLELGKFDIHCGLYSEAIEKLAKAEKRNPDSFEIKYFFAMAHELSGDIDKAIHWYQLACRYDFESPSRARLACLNMKMGFAFEALKHLDRLCEKSPLLDKYRVMRSAILFETKNESSGRLELDEAYKISDTSPLVQFEHYFQAGHRGILEKLFEQTDFFEPPLLECAFDYIDFGLYHRAMKVIDSLKSHSQLALLVRAWLNFRLSNKAQAHKDIELACASDPVNMQAWRLEMLGILNWAIGLHPEKGRLHYHLGNLLMARWRTQEAFAEWKKAEKLGEKTVILQMNIAKWHINISKDQASAMRALKKAREFAQTDIHQLVIESDLLRSMGRYEDILKLLKKHPMQLSKSCRLGHDFAKALLEKKSYDMFDKFVASCNYSENWQMSSPIDILPERYLKEALQMFNSGKYQQAAELFAKMNDVPSNLCRYPRAQNGVGKDGIYVASLYYIGACHEKLGSRKIAEEFFEKVVAIETPVAWEPLYWYNAWKGRYYQALALQKLGRTAMANIIFDSLEKIAKNVEAFPIAARKEFLSLATKGMLSNDYLKVPDVASVHVDTIAEL